MILYHFTSRSHIDAVLREGLTLGVIPRTMTNYLTNYQWLTADPDWFQEWAAGFSHTYHRTEHRITVAIPRNRYTNLSRWSEVAHQVAPAAMIETLNAYGSPEDWYVYHGRIPPAWFVDIWTRRLPDSWEKAYRGHLPGERLVVQEQQQDKMS